MPSVLSDTIMEQARRGDFTGLKLAGLVRKSTIEEADKPNRKQKPYQTGADIKSCDMQVRDCKVYTVSRGGAYVDTYYEPDTSAWKRRKVVQPDGSVIYRVIRPVYEKALKDLKQGISQNGSPFDGLVVYDIDRLTRDNRDLEDAIDVVVFDKKLVLDITGTLDLLTENGRDMARVLVTMIGKQSGATSRRVSNMRRHIAYAGIPTSQRRPFGWQADKRTRDEFESGLLVEAAADVLHGVGINTICREWEERSIKTPQGNPWTKNALKYVLRSPRIAGYAIYQGKLIYDDDGQPVKGQWDRILEPAVWKEVCAVLTDPERCGKHIHRDGRKHLLSSLIRCANCSRKMHGNKRYGTLGGFFYACPSPNKGYGCGTVAISGPQTDAHVMELVLKYLADQPVQTKAKPWPKEQVLAEHTTQIDELMAAYRSKQLPGAIVFPQVAELQNIIDAMQLERSEWNREQARATDNPGDIATMLPLQSVERQRAVLETLISAVVIKQAAYKGEWFKPGRIEIIWR